MMQTQLNTKEISLHKYTTTIRKLVIGTDLEKKQEACASEKTQKRHQVLWLQE
uniref:Uncharacterized protein n=1 Tax=Manihot esculenta TaxID=3983 RepID=A0A2C9V9E7_MANES